MVLFLRVVCFRLVHNKVELTCGYRTERFRDLLAVGPPDCFLWAKIKFTS